MKALFFDIDGTLVSFKTHQIPQSAIEAIARAREAGNKIIISTGRPLSIINNLAPLQQRGLIDGYITMNGAYCMVNGRRLHSVAMPEDEVKAIDAFCKDNKYAAIYMGEHSVTLAGPRERAIELFLNQLKTPPLPFTEYGLPLHHPILQITAFFPQDAQTIIQNSTPHCEYGRWHPEFVDITAKGVTKAQGMDIILAHLNIPLENSIAFGDGGNDIAMLRHANIGVAMGNAADNVKQAADFITRSVDDNGIAFAIESNL